MEEETGEGDCPIFNATEKWFFRTFSSTLRAKNTRVNACVCVCVCERGRFVRERELKGEIERVKDGERERWWEREKECEKERERDREGVGEVANDSLEDNRMKDLFQCV